MPPAGVIPRTISAIFADIAKRGDYQYTVHITYLEIYNEAGHDLLDPDREVKSMDDLPKVRFEWPWPTSVVMAGAWPPRQKGVRCNANMACNAKGSLWQLPLEVPDCQASLSYVLRYMRCSCAGRLERNAFPSGL